MKSFNSKLFLLIMSILMVGSYHFSHSKKSARTANKIEIKFTNPSPLTDTLSVNKLLKQNKFSKSTLKKDMVVLDSIEKVFKDLPEIKNVNVFAYPEGKIGIDIEERKPVLRIINGNNPEDSALNIKYFKPDSEEKISSLLNAASTYNAKDCNSRPT